MFVEVRCKFCRSLLYEIEEGATCTVRIKCRRGTCQRMVEYKFPEPAKAATGQAEKNAVALTAPPR